jgi:rSAM/selenodomain-associated transferase 1
VSSDQLLIFARYPVDGRVKTRLVPPLATATATRLYRAFLLDAVERWSRAGDFGTIVCVADEDDLGAMRSLLDAELPRHTVRVEAQRGPGLGERLAHAIERSLSGGARRVCAIGSDHPTLPSAMIVDAFERCDHDVVIGPADDGGYWLIGMERAHGELFRDMPWSSPELYRTTIERCAQHGLGVRRLGRWYDVDTARDLERMWRERETAPLGARTMKMMEEVMMATAGRES